jgi:hypothetical protein
MAVDSLATADDLASFPGAPFDELLVEVAQESVRAEAGWHIAPVRTETLYLYAHGGAYLSIPSRRIVSVSAVRYGPSLTEITSGWTLAHGGSLYLYSGWTAGPVEVDLTHGYEETPLDLLPVIVNRAASAADPRDPSIQAITTVAGPFTNTERYGSGSSSSGYSVDPRIAKYALLDGVA